MNLLEFGYIAYLLSKEYSCKKQDNEALESFLYELAECVNYTPLETDPQGRREFFDGFNDWLTKGDNS